MWSPVKDHDARKCEVDGRSEEYWRDSDTDEISIIRQNGKDQ